MHLKHIMMIAVAAAALASHRDAAAGYGPPETNLQNIIPLWEYRQKVFDDKTLNNTPVGQARAQARAAAWNPDDPVIKEDTYALTNAKIVLINYKLLQQDFPFLRGKSESAIDAWVLANAAYIARRQVERWGTQGPDERVSTQIPHREDNPKKAYRPFEYGRALVFPVTHIDTGAPAAGFLDVKGAGSRNPSRENHRNGLMSLGECLREYTFENMVNQVLSHAYRKGIRLGDGSESLPTATPTIGSYAVIYAGFSITPGNDPAGLYLRQAHTRWNLPTWDGDGPLIPDFEQDSLQVTGSGHLRTQSKVRLGKILALYNIWASTNSSEGLLRFSQANLQGSRDNRIFDFGSVLGGPNGDATPWGKETIPNFGEAKTIPFELWGWDHERDEAKDRPWSWAHDAAKAIASYLEVTPTGNDYRAWAGKHFDNMIKDPLTQLGIWAEPVQVTW